jgi:hypothetical protein
VALQQRISNLAQFNGGTGGVFPHNDAYSPVWRGTYR